MALTAASPNVMRVERLEASSWEQGLSALGYGPLTFFRTKEWIQTVAGVYGLRTFYLGCRSNTSDKMVAMLPLVEVRSRVFGHRMISLPFCEYGGIVFDPNVSSEECDHALGALNEAAWGIAKEQGAWHVEYRTGDRNTLPRGLRSCPSNYVTFNVTGELGEVWKKIDRKLRGQIESWHKHRYDEVVAIKPDTEDFEHFYRQYATLESRRGSPMHSKRFFDAILRFDSVTVIGAQVKDYFKTASYIMLVEHAGFMNWWMNVNEPALRQFNGTAMLLWTAMQTIAAKNSGRVSLDMGRTRVGSGVYNYKKQWGGREEELITVDNFGNTVLDVQPTDRKMALASSVWKHLPLSVTRRLGPMVIKGLAL